jgi:hypothetical protein
MYGGSSEIGCGDIGSGSSEIGSGENDSGGEGQCPESVARHDG